MNEVYRLLFAEYGPQNWWPGDTPFEVMVGAVLTQNTNWTNVEKAISNLTKTNNLSPQKILSLEHEQLAELITPSGYFNVKAQRLKSFVSWYIGAGEYQVINSMDTRGLRASLLAVKGVGPETADDMLLYAFDRKVFVIDAYFRRIFSRLGFINGDEKYEQLRLMAEDEVTNDVQIYNEYHALLVEHAKRHCKIKPRCEGCCLLEKCGFESS